MAEKGRLFTGARARFLIEGKKVGYATDVSGGEEIEYFPIEILDNIRVEEHVPVAYRVVGFTARTFKIVGETLKSLGHFPSLGNSVEEHLNNILINGDLVCTIEDNQTGQTIATFRQVKVASTNFQITARGVVGEDISFVAISLADESEVP